MVVVQLVPEYQTPFWALTSTAKSAQALGQQESLTGRRQKPLSTKCSSSEIYGGLSSSENQSHHTGIPGPHNWFSGELSAVVASRFWSISLLGVLSLDWICHFSPITPLGKHGVIALGVCVHLSTVLNHCSAPGTAVLRHLPAFLPVVFCDLFNHC